MIDATYIKPPTQHVGPVTVRSTGAPSRLMISIVGVKPPPPQVGTLLCTKPVPSGSALVASHRQMSAQAQQHILQGLSVRKASVPGATPRRESITSNLSARARPKQHRWKQPECSCTNATGSPVLKSYTSYWFSCAFAFG